MAYIAETTQEIAMKTDVYKVREYIASSIERDEGTLEFIERSSNKDNPQLVKMQHETAARMDFAKSVLRALEHGDFVDLRSFTKHL